MEDRILMLIDSFGSGGAQRQIVNIAKGLKQNGLYIEFAIYFPEYEHFKSEVVAAGIPINILKRDDRFFSTILSLVQLIRKKKISLIISFLDTPNFYAEVVSKITGIKCIVSERSAFSNPRRIPVKKRILCNLHRLANKIIVNSYNHKDALVNTFPFLKHKTEVILNIVSPAFFNIYSKRQWDENVKILCVGSINNNKNPKVLIEALLILKNKYNHIISVDWAGKKGAPVADIQYFEECNTLINQYGLQNDWQWLGEVNNITELHARHNFLIHASFFEGLPNAICEAMASGMIVIASNVCEHPKLLSNLNADLLFDPDNAGQLAQKIFEILSLKKQDKETLSNKIYQRATELFAETIVIGKFQKAAAEVKNY